MAIVVFQHSEADRPGRLGLVLRDHGVKLDIRRLDLSADDDAQGVPPDFDNVDGVISLGGPQDPVCNEPWVDAQIEYLRAAHERSLPVIGICLGCQLLVRALGGEVRRCEKPEWGFGRVSQTPPGNTDRILGGVPWATWQFQCHDWEAADVPNGATLLQSSEGTKVQGFTAGLRTYAFQYHPEFDRQMIALIAAAHPDRFSVSGGDGETVSAQTERHYDAYARIGNRIFENMAVLLLPLPGRVR